MKTLKTLAARKVYPVEIIAVLIILGIWRRSPCRGTSILANANREPSMRHFRTERPRKPCLGRSENFNQRLGDDTLTWEQNEQGLGY
jgi:hypothetical protein